jgi:mono/diheme cytochrome c family protein
MSKSKSSLARRGFLKGATAGAAAIVAQIKLAQPAFIAYVRNPAPGGMPPYRAKVMSDQELADVFAYIKTLPEPPAASSIPILNQ